MSKLHVVIDDECGLLIVPEGIEITNEFFVPIHGLPLLIVPEGIEI